MVKPLSRLPLLPFAVFTCYARTLHTLTTPQHFPAPG